MNNENQEDISWSEYQLERCKTLFHSDDFANQDVFNYFVMALSHDKKPVRIVVDKELNDEEGPFVAYFDDEDNAYFALFFGDTNSCNKFIEDNKLIFDPRTDLRP